MKRLLSNILRHLLAVTLPVFLLVNSAASQTPNLGSPALGARPDLNVLEPDAFKPDPLVYPSWDPETGPLYGESITELLRNKNFSSLPEGASTGGNARMLRTYPYERTYHTQASQGLAGGAHFIRNNVSDTVTCTAYMSSLTYDQPLADYAFDPNTEQVISLPRGWRLTLSCAVLGSDRYGLEPGRRYFFLRPAGRIVLQHVSINTNFN